MAMSISSFEWLPSKHQDPFAGASTRDGLIDKAMLRKHDSTDSIGAFTVHPLLVSDGVLILRAIPASVSARNVPAAIDAADRAMAKITVISRLAGNWLDSGGRT